ncbi:MAG: hypothetical protein V1807_02680 [Patescibacteria group bacterium]
MSFLTRDGRKELAGKLEELIEWLETFANDALRLEDGCVGKYTTEIIGLMSAVRDLKKVILRYYKQDEKDVYFSWSEIQYSIMHHVRAWQWTFRAIPEADDHARYLEMILKHCRTVIVSLDGNFWVYEEGDHLPQEVLDRWLAGKRPDPVQTESGPVSPSWGYEIVTIVPGFVMHPTLELFFTISPKVDIKITVYPVSGEVEESAEVPATV